MIVLFVVIALLVLTGLFVLWASRLPGGLTIDFGTGTAYEIELVVALLGLLLLGAAIAVIWSFVTGLLSFPSRFGKARRASKVREANRALADGLLAAEAGDAVLAKKLSKKAAQYAEDDRLKLLLEARTAEVSDDWANAERAWGQLARLPGGQMAGLRGAAAAASARGDLTSSETRAKEALELKSSADWPFNSLFDTQVAAARRADALTTLENGERRNQIPADRSRRRRAVLLTAHALQLSNTERRQAHQQLSEAVKAAPDFPIASYHFARQLMIEDKARQAQSALEAAWRSRPHPALAQLSRKLDPESTPDVVTQRLRNLANAHPEHRESRILKAELAMADRAWLDAVKAIALLVEEKPTARLCLLMEKALRGYGDMDEAERWARMAITASREPEWSDIDPKGGTFMLSDRDWSRMIYAFGDAGNLIHPRYEAYERELDASKPLALPGPDGTDRIQSAKSKSIAAPPLDYVPEDDGT